MPERRSRSRFTRLRRLGTAGCVVLLLVAACAWIAGVRRPGVVDYRWGHTRETTPTAADPWAWSFEARSFSLSNTWEGVAVAGTRYVSRAPTEAELEPWKQWMGWHSTKVARVGGRGVAPPPRTYFKAWDDFGLLGLGVSKGSRQGVESRSVAAPHWALAGFAALAAAALVRPDLRRWRRRRRGRCVACGYDRFGLAATASCPECNAPGPAPCPAAGATQP